MKSDFEKRLTGGHPNSLGNTVQVVNLVLKDRSRIEELFSCYDSDDEVVRLRTSSAFKRIFRENPDWFKPLVGKFFSKIPKLKQPSAEWTLAQICLECEEQLTPARKKKAREIIKSFLVESNDWIVLNTSLEVLGTWSAEDKDLRKWILPKLRKLTKDERKSVAKRAEKQLAKLR